MLFLTWFLLTVDDFRSLNKLSMVLPCFREVEREEMLLRLVLSDVFSELKPPSF
jgi:hypothetical protein